MSAHRLARQVLGELFGEDVAAVAGLLMDWNGQTLLTLEKNAQAKGVSGKVRQSLAVLIQHNLVVFAKSPRGSGRAEYNLSTDQCLHLIRYPKCMALAKTLYHDEGEIIVEELFAQGQDTASNLVYRAAQRLNPAETPAKALPAVVKKLVMTFNEMVRCHFIQRCGAVEPPSATAAEGNSDVPELKCPDALTYFVPEIDTKTIVDAVNKARRSDDEESAAGKRLTSTSDASVYWRLNSDRFLREFRDGIIVQAVTKRIDSSAGNMMRSLLNMMNETSPWAGTSCHLHQIDLTNRIEKAEPNSAIGCDERLKKFQDQYLKVLEDDRTRFLDKVGDAGGGQYVINTKHLLGELTAAAADGIVLEKFGSKALRIFRVVRQKRHVEESQLQGFVMIPAKEIKLLTYQLIENNFVQLEELRKSLGGSANAPSKCFYLFTVDMNQVARMLLDQCYKAVGNAYVRKKHEVSTNQRLLDKQEKIDSICNNLKAQQEEGGAENAEELQIQLQEINDMLSPVERDSAKRIHERMDQLCRAMGQIDDTLLVLILYLRYATSS